MFISMISRPCLSTACAIGVASLRSRFVISQMSWMTSSNECLSSFQMVSEYGVRSGLKAKDSFIRGHIQFSWRAVKDAEKKIEGKIDGETHVIPECWHCALK